MSPQHGQNIRVNETPNQSEVEVRKWQTKQHTLPQ